MNILRKSFIAICLLHLWVYAVFGEETADQPITFSFADQHKDSMSLKPEFEKPMIVAVSDKKGYKELQDWIVPLTKKFGKSVEFFAIADLRPVPGPLKGLVRRKFRKEFSYNVAMDWNGEAVEKLSTKPDTANLILLDRAGLPLVAVDGPATKENLEIMIKAIEADLQTRRATTVAKSEKPLDQ